MIFWSAATGREPAWLFGAEYLTPQMEVEVRAKAGVGLKMLIRRQAIRGQEDSLFS